MQEHQREVLEKLAAMLAFAGNIEYEETPDGIMFVGPDGKYLTSEQVTKALVYAIEFMAASAEVIKEILE